MIGSEAHIARRKNAGDVGLEQKRKPVKGPALRRFVVHHQVSASENVSLLVAYHQIRLQAGSAGAHR